MEFEDRRLEELEMNYVVATEGATARFRRGDAAGAIGSDRHSMVGLSLAYVVAIAVIVIPRIL